jgi:hypothetical protein
MALGQVTFCKVSRRLNKVSFGGKVCKSRGGKHRDHVDEVELGAEVTGKVSCYL